MRPRKNEETLVDVLDVLLRDGAVLRADVIVSVADIPLVGIKLTAAIAGMETMTEYGLFEEWDVERRQSALSRRQHKRDRSTPPDELERITVGTTPDGRRSEDTDGDRSERNKDDRSRDNDAGGRGRDGDDDPSRDSNDERSGSDDAD